MTAYLILAIGSLMFWSLYQMAPNGLMLFAVHNVDLMVGPVKIQPQWIQNINTVCIVLGGPIFAALFVRMRARGWRIDIPQQFAASLLLMALAFFILTLGIKLAGPDGKSVMHAELKIGDSMVMLSDEFPQMGSRSPQTLGGTTAAIFLYVPDVDAAFKRAVDAGAKAIMPPTDMFWGDRFGKLVDPFGHEWAMATHKEDLSPEEVQKRAAAARASMGQPCA